MQRLSSKGETFIKSFERLRLTAYRCSSGVLTIGWGHTGAVSKGDKITLSAAKIYFKSDCLTVIRQLEPLNLRLSQNEFDAIVSFCFNCGFNAFRESTLLKRIKENPRHPDIRNQFMRWIYSAGKVSRGLQERRKKEADMYCLAVYKNHN